MNSPPSDEREQNHKKKSKPTGKKTPNKKKIKKQQLDKNSLIKLGILAAIIVVVLVTVLSPWAIVDGQIGINTPLTGSNNFDLNLELYGYKAKYEAGSKERNISREGEVSFTNIMDSEFGDAVGFLKGSSKNYSYFIKAPAGDKIRVYVNTSVDRVPWWPAIMDQECRIDITLVHPEGLGTVTINTVWIRVWSNWDDKAKEYTEYTELWESDVDDTLTASKNTKSYSTMVSIDKDMGDKIGIIGMADVDIQDDTSATLSTSSDIPMSTSPNLSINIIPLSTEETVNVLFLALAFPVLMVVMVLSMISILFTLMGKTRGRYGLPLSIGILGLMAPFMYTSGAKTLVALVGFEEFLTIEPMLYLGVVAGALGFVLFALELLVFGKADDTKRFKKKAKKDRNAKSETDTEDMDKDENAGEEVEFFSAPSEPKQSEPEQAVTKPIESEPTETQAIGPEPTEVVEHDPSTEMPYQESGIKEAEIVQEDEEQPPQ